MPFRFRLTLKAPNGGQDNFFLWSIVILPVIAEGAYIFDAYYYLSDYTSTHSYKGLLSTVLVVFTYLRYCAPIESTKILGNYYIILCILNEIGTIGYLINYIQHKATFNIVIYVGWALLEIIMTIFLIYYRVINHCHPNFHVESKHLFHFISRLELILAIFIPFFINNISITLTKHSIAFFLLFDFFSESYCRFQGFWIKSTLYLFVCTVTVCVGSEWVFSNEDRRIYEVVSSSFELISACLCDILIILQFIPYHFKPIGISKIAREALIFQQNVRTDSEAIVMDFRTIETDLETIEIISEPTLTREISKDSVINIIL